MSENYLDHLIAPAGAAPMPAGSSRSRRRRHLAALGTVMALAAAVLATAAGTSASAAPLDDLGGLHCSVHQLTVALADPGPADQVMWGQLCYRGPAEPGTVQLLVHGGTYTHAYWDFPYGNGYYSYLDAATLAGYATFNVDRIGAGNSSHPPSSLVTVPAGAVALYDANPDLGADFGTDFYPAADDPLFASSGLDPGYLTTTPGVRESLFYYPATTDPNVVALDEATKDTLTFAEATGFSVITPPPSQGLTVPVLLVDGQYDDIFCVNVTAYNCGDRASVQAFESQFYPPQAHVQVLTIPGTGHDLALSTTAPITDAAMLDWALATVAP